MRRLTLILVAIALSSALGACGFKLRGAYELPFDTLAIALPETAELHAILKRNIEASTNTHIVKDPKSAQAILTITADQPLKTILSLDSAGRVREYRLQRTVSFRIHNADNHDLLLPGTIVIGRDISFNDSQVLSKESEEALLWRDIQNDLVQQLLRRLAAAKPTAPETE
jgi:LPS-assembly lipoprotein